MKRNSDLFWNSCFFRFYWTDDLHLECSKTRTLVECLVRSSRYVDDHRSISSPPSLWNLLCIGNCIDLPPGYSRHDRCYFDLHSRIAYVLVPSRLYPSDFSTTSN